MMNKKISYIKTILIIIACAAFCAGAAGFAVSAFAAEKTVSSVTIEIDYGDYDGKNLPKGKAGKSYPVFDCVAKDNEGVAASEIRITVKNSDGQTVPQKGGRFETASVGEYTIEYVAISGYLTATETIKIFVEEYSDTIVYDDNGENVPSAAQTGLVVTADFGTFSGGVGDLTIRTVLTLEKSAIALKTTGTGVYFVPEKQGLYEISYIARDFVGDEKAVIKAIEVKDSAAPVVKKPSVPASVISGESLELPLANGILYKSGNKYYLPVKVYFDGETVGADMKIENVRAGRHTVKYVCENPEEAGAKTEYEFSLIGKERELADGERLFDNYFDFYNCEPFTGANKDYTVRIDKTEKATFAFSRRIPVSYLNFDISTKASVADYSDLYFVLTDSENAEDCVRIRIKRLSSYSNLYLSYDDESRTVTNADTGALIEEIKNYADGRTFEGFKSGKAYVSFEINGVKKAVELALKKVASGIITTDTEDYASPVFMPHDDFRSAYVSYIGHSVYLPKLRAFDLLDPNVKITLMVYDEESKIYEGEGGYNLEITKSGEYIAEYVAVDENGNKKTQMCSITVGDMVSPVIKVADIKGVVSVGEELTLPVAEITDNDTPSEDILTYVYVIKGNNRKEFAGETYKFTEAGEYIVRYVAYDANQNFAVVEFKIICK